MPSACCNASKHGSYFGNKTFCLSDGQLAFSSKGKKNDNQEQSFTGLSRTSTSEVMTLWHYKNMFIIIIIIKLYHFTLDTPCIL